MKRSQALLRLSFSKIKVKRVLDYLMRTDHKGMKKNVEFHPFGVYLVPVSEVPVLLLTNILIYGNRFIYS